MFLLAWHVRVKNSLGCATIVLSSKQTERVLVEHVEGKLTYRLVL